jgi:hypothetical protein
MKKLIKAAAMASTMALSLSLSQLSLAAEQPGVVVEEDPTMLAMTSDLLFVRPVMLVGTVLGSAVWLVSSPFSLAGGNAMQAADTLVVGPAKTTFVRCLGCVGDGYKHNSE